MNECSPVQHIGNSKHSQESREHSEKDDNAEKQVYDPAKQNHPNSICHVADSSEQSDSLKCYQAPSKRSLKKMLKKEKWLEYKPIKRAQERERLKKRKAEAKLTNTKVGPSRKALKRSKMSSSSCKVTVVVDFSFTHLMNCKDLSKCLKQLCFCYGANRRVANPLQFYVSRFVGAAKQEMEKNEGYTNWDVNFKEEHFIDLFKKEDLIYLTSDSDNIINELVDDKVYIIGGLVDHNAHKGLCLKTAEELGIGHGRFPIQENIDMKTRKVLAINHVFEILANVSNGTSWKDALLKVIPERKGAAELNGSE